MLGTPLQRKRRKRRGVIPVFVLLHGRAPRPGRAVAAPLRGPASGWRAVV